MCIESETKSSETSPRNSLSISSMHSPRLPTSSSTDEQQQQQPEQQEISSDIEKPSSGTRTNTPSNIPGNRSDVDSPVRSYAVIETDSSELDQIIDILRQFFPNTRIVECNNSSSNPSRTPSRSSLAAAPQQQTSIESNSSLRVPSSTSNRYRSHSHSISDKSSFESDIFQNSACLPSESSTPNFNDSSSASANSQVRRRYLFGLSPMVVFIQAFKGKVKDYLQRRYLEQINENQTRKDTFLKCRSDDLNYRCLKRDSSSGLVQSFEHISKPEHHHHHHHAYLSTPPGSSTHLKSNTGVKARSFDSSSLLLQHSVSDTNLCCALSASDTDFVQSSSGNIARSQSKRGLLQRCATIDMEDAPASNIDDEQMTSSPTSPIQDEKVDGGRITFSIDRPDDEVDEEDEQDIKSPSMPFYRQHQRRSEPFRHSYSEQQTSEEHNRNYLLPYRHSFEHQSQHEKRSSTSTTASNMPFTGGVPVSNHSPYSASSDPGPYHAMWSNTPTNPYGLVNFHFPKSQDHLVASAQGSIAQLSTLTKILCDEPSVFTPISPR